MLTDPIKTYTYKDYLTYDECERIEIIEGEIINMSPAPSRIHQKIITTFFVQILIFFIALRKYMKNLKKLIIVMIMVILFFKKFI